MSKLGPPKQTAVTLSAGIGISNKTFPVLFDKNDEQKKIRLINALLYSIKKEKNYFGSTLKIFEPMKAVTYRLPSVSIVSPSGRYPGIFPFKLKSLTRRSLAVRIGSTC